MRPNKLHTLNSVLQKVLALTPLSVDTLGDTPLSQKKSYLHYRHKFLFAPLALTVLCTGQASGSMQEQCPAPSPDAKKVYMSLSGGGYHAHAGASAVMMSLIDRTRQAKSENSLGMCEVTKNIDAISSNSGGSWFLSQAAYTDISLKALEGPDAWRAYTTDNGYFGQAWQYIDTHRINVGTVCRMITAFAPAEYNTCVDRLESGDSFLKFLLSSGDANWHTLAQNAVFGAKFSNPDWNMVPEVSGSITGGRQAWAKDKSLVFASALLTDAPALNRFTETKLMGSLQGSQDTSDKPVPGAAPVMFAVPASSDVNATLTFLPGGTTTLKYGHWDETFIAWKDRQYSLRPDTPIDEANIIDVAASSSAAGGGFIDIPDMKESGISIFKFPAALAARLDNFAPAFTLDPSAGPKYHGPVGEDKSPDALYDAKIVRLADGGFVDNTAVAYMLKYLSDNSKLANGFDILAMDNYPAPPLMDLDSKEYFPTGPDVSRLFGYGKQPDGTQKSELLSFLDFTGISPQVFESGAYFKDNPDGPGKVPTKGADWCAWVDPDPQQARKISATDTKCKIITVDVQSPQAEMQHCNLYFSYTKYDVKLVGNEHFNIGAGVTGNLHVFSILGSETGVVPDNEFQAACYGKMMEGVHTAVSKDQFGDTLVSLLGLQK